MRKHGLFIRVTLTSSALCLTACAKTTFTTSAASLAAASSCTDALNGVTVPVKTLFVVDTSGSNAGDYTYTGSDPSKSIRGGSIT